MKKTVSRTDFEAAALYNLLYMYEPMDEIRRCASQYNFTPHLVELLEDLIRSFHEEKTPFDKLYPLLGEPGDKLYPSRPGKLSQAERVSLIEWFTDHLSHDKRSRLTE